MCVAATLFRCNNAFMREILMWVTVTLLQFTELRLCNKEWLCLFQFVHLFCEFVKHTLLPASVLISPPCQHQAGGGRDLHCCNFKVQLRQWGSGQSLLTKCKITPFTCKVSSYMLHKYISRKMPPLMKYQISPPQGPVCSNRPGPKKKGFVRSSKGEMVWPLDLEIVFLKLTSHFDNDSESPWLKHVWYECHM